MALQPGTRLGPYAVVSALGSGGMGEVYRAQDTRLARVVAIKTLSERLESNAQAIERFEREARAAASLNHPNICTIYDVGTDPPFIAMELLEGETLQQRLTRGPLDVGDRRGHHARRSSMRSTPRTPRASCIATSSPRTSSSPTRGPKILDFGLAKAVPRPLQPTDATQADQAARVAAHGRGRDGRNGRLHVAGAAARPAARREQRSLLARARAVRDGDGASAFAGETSAVIAAAILQEMPVRRGTFAKTCRRGSRTSSSRRSRRIRGIARRRQPSCAPISGG